MRLRRGVLGFYEGGRPEQIEALPRYQQTVRSLLGGLLDSHRPTLEEEWARQAEVRAIAALAIQARMPWDSPPELVELAYLDDKGNPVALKEYDDALSAQGWRDWLHG